MQYRGQKPDKWEGLPLLILKYITSYIVDIGRFVFEPKKYLDEVSMESPVSICKRLIILAMGFDFIVLSLFYVIFGTPIFKDPFSLLPKLFGIALLETALGLILVPPFLLTGAICKSKPGVKKSITYVLTFKFVYFLIPVILYSLFLVTENYLVAVIRGVIYYVLLLMLFILFPLLFSSGLRNKATAVVVSITSCFAAIVILSIVLMYVPFDLDKFKKSTLLYDPIAVEALEVRKEIGGSVKIDISDLDRFRQVLFKAVQEGERRDGRVWISLRGIKEEFSRLKYIWKDKQKTYNRDLQKQLDTINKCKLSAKYNTNKTFLKLREKATSAGLNLIQEVDELTVEFNADISAVVNKLTNISKLQSDYYDSEIEYLRSTAQYYQFIVMCRNFLILIY